MTIKIFEANKLEETLVKQCQECKKIGIGNDWYSEDNWEKLGKLNESFAQKYELYQKERDNKNISHGLCEGCLEETEKKAFNCQGKTEYRENLGNYSIYA